MVSRTTAQRMSKVDTAWLRMDSESNLMMIVGVWVIRPGIAYADLHERLEERLLKYPRFVQCVMEDSAGATWVQDRNFDLTHHLVREKLLIGTEQTAQQALQGRLAQLCTEPLDRTRPLWQFHFVENYEGGSALMVRIHHCIADGLALISVMQSLVDGGTSPAVNPSEVHRDDAAGAQDWMAEALLKPFTAMAVRVLGMAGQQGSVDVAKLAYQALADLSALAMMEDDSPTSLKGIPGQSKRVAWCPPLSLEEVKVVGKALHCSINDVLLSCVAGAMRQYLRDNGEGVRGKEIRVMVPVNLRSASRAHDLGNEFGLAPLVLPLGLENPVERIYEVRRRMAELKGSMQPMMAFGMLAVAGVLVKPAQDALLGLFSKKTTAVITNVPGPAKKLHICGACIEEALFWVPQSGTVGVGVSILSYGGGVQFGIVADSLLCPEPQRIIDLFSPEFDKLTTLTLMLPWGDQVERS